MQELTSPKEMRAWSRAERARGRRIGFVPTMGFLHEGHLQLVDRAKQRADRVVLSIFVNPLQFGPTEDLAQYPRDLERDRRLAAERGVDCLFVPDRSAMYPTEPLVRVNPGPMADTLEGAARPGHFAGVLTVVAKLFHIVEPDLVVFGRKDFQQATLVRRLAADLDFGLEIDVAPTVRELDGLALSSRNTYLKGDDRRAALALSRALRAVEQAWRSGEADPQALQRRGMQALTTPGVSPEYLALVDEQMRPVARVDAITTTVRASPPRTSPPRWCGGPGCGRAPRSDPGAAPRPPPGPSSPRSAARMSSVWRRSCRRGRRRCTRPRASARAGSRQPGCTTRCATHPRPTSSPTAPSRPSAPDMTARPIKDCSTRCVTTRSGLRSGTTSARCSIWRTISSLGEHSTRSSGAHSPPACPRSATRS